MVPLPPPSLPPWVDPFAGSSTIFIVLDDLFLPRSWKIPFQPVQLSSLQFSFLPSSLRSFVDQLLFPSPEDLPDPSSSLPFSFSSFLSKKLCGLIIEDVITIWLDRLNIKHLQFSLFEQKFNLAIEGTYFFP